MTKRGAALRLPREPRVEHVLAEWQHPGRAGGTQAAVTVVPALGQAEQVLVAAQRRIVVVVARRIHGARHDQALVQQYGADLSAARNGIIRGPRNRLMWYPP